MFIGHYAVALAAKKKAPNVSLGILILAAQLADLIWPLFLLLGIEMVQIDPGNTVVTPLNFVHYPFTHSLLAALMWAVALGAVYFYFKHRRTDALIVGVLVVSHWILDFIVHRPDLPLLPNETTLLGLGAWNSLPLTLLLEFGLLALGVFVYLKVTEAKDRVGTYAFWSLIVFLVLIYIANIMSPPPPSAEAIGYVGLASWLMIAWGFWIDRHRHVKEVPVQ